MVLSRQLANFLFVCHWNPLYKATISHPFQQLGNFPQQSPMSTLTADTSEIGGKKKNLELCCETSFSFKQQFDYDLWDLIFLSVFKQILACVCVCVFLPQFQGNTHIGEENGKKTAWSSDLLKNWSMHQHKYCMRCVVWPEERQPVLNFVHLRRWPLCLPAEKGNSPLSTRNCLLPPAADAAN